MKSVKQIENLRKVFAISNQAYKLARAISEAFGNDKKEISNIERLHNIMFFELNKEDPSLKNIEYLLLQMELETRKN